MGEARTRFLVGPREDGRRLDLYLCERIGGLSRSRVQRMIKDRVLLSWGAKARPSTPIRAGGEITIRVEQIEEPALDLPLSILTRGDGWLAVDKPAGIPVHPVNKERKNTLIHVLRDQERCSALRLVHRLDRDTSGVMIVADSSESASRLGKLLVSGSVRKSYRALVRGVVQDDCGSCDQPIGKALNSEIYTRQGVREDGQACLTHWKVLSRGQECSLLDVQIETGRRHQIRVHLEALGHPVLGDLLYGRDDQAYLRLVRGEGDVREDEPGAKRQLLHCAELAFPEGLAPTKLGSGGRVTQIRSPLPADFIAEMKRQRCPQVE